jgi:hypothetical protein
MQVARRAHGQTTLRSSIRVPDAGSVRNERSPMPAVASIIWPWGTSFLAAVISCTICVLWARSKGHSGLG